MSFIDHLVALSSHPNSKTFICTGGDHETRLWQDSHSPDGILVSAESHDGFEIFQPDFGRMIPGSGQDGSGGGNEDVGDAMSVSIV